MDKLLELLKSAGIDVSSLEDGALSGLVESLNGQIQGAVEEGTAEANKRLAEMDLRRKNQDAKMSEYVKQIEALQKQAQEQPRTPTYQPAQLLEQQPDFRSLVDTEIKPIREMVQQMATAFQNQQKELEQQRARNLRREAIDQLASEMPLLKDPRFAALMPETTDPDVLKKYGETLTGLAKAAETDAYQKVRDGFVPASVPPRVSPGNEQEFQAELNRISGMERSGELTPQQATAKIQELAALMKPE